MMVERNLAKWIILVTKLAYFDPPFNVLFRDVLSKNSCVGVVEYF